MKTQQSQPSNQPSSACPQITLPAMPAPSLAGHCLVLCSRGLVRLQTLGNANGTATQPLAIQLRTDNGVANTQEFCVHGQRPVLRIQTSRGYSIEGTYNQKVRVVDNEGNWCWKELQAIANGDQVPIRIGGMMNDPEPIFLPPLPDAYWTSDYSAFVPRYMTPELAELIGYFMGDGSLHTRGIRLCVANDDPDVALRLEDLGRSLFGLSAKITARKGYKEVTFNSVRLVLWWEGCGFTKLAPSHHHRGKGYVSRIPDAILHTNDPTVYAGFIRGLFEADGSRTNQYVSFSTSSKAFCRDIQVLLLSLGFVTTQKSEDARTGRWSENGLNSLRLLNTSATTRFLNEIGFVSSRKQFQQVEDHPQAGRYDHIPVPRRLVDELAPANDSLRKILLMALARNGTVSRRAAQALLDRNENEELKFLLSFFYDRVATIEATKEHAAFGVAMTPITPYLANGFLCLGAS